MTEENKDMNQSGQQKELPASLDRHLRALLAENDLTKFQEQLPAEFISDASEGLEYVPDFKQLEPVLQQMNQQMHQQLRHKKTHDRKKPLRDPGWAYWAIIIILLLSIITFIAIRILLSH